MSRGSDGLVGQLEALNAELEDKLKSSRGTVELLQGRLEEQRRGYEDTDEASVQEHIGQRIAASTQLVRIRSSGRLMHSLTTSSTHSVTVLCRVHATPEAHPDVI